MQGIADEQNRGKSGFHRQCFILAVHSTVQVFNVHRMGQTLRRVKPINNRKPNSTG